MAEQIFEIVGDVSWSPKSTKDDGGNFIQVRVLVDINLPLCCGRVITLENGEKSWVRFQYKRLPKLCYWWGRLTNNDKECELWIESKGMLTSDQKQFGPFLRVHHSMQVVGMCSLSLVFLTERKKNQRTQRKEMGIRELHQRMVFRRVVRWTSSWLGSYSMKKKKQQQ